MTFAMKLQDERQCGRAEGLAEGQTARLLRDISSLMENRGITALEAMDWLNVPENQREKILSELPQ